MTYYESRDCIANSKYRQKYMDVYDVISDHTLKKPPKIQKYKLLAGVGGGGGGDVGGGVWEILIWNLTHHGSIKISSIIQYRGLLSFNECNFYL